MSQKKSIDIKCLHCEVIFPENAKGDGGRPACPQCGEEIDILDVRFPGREDLTGTRYVEPDDDDDSEDDDDLEEYVEEDYDEQEQED